MTILHCVRRGVMLLTVLGSCGCATLANGRHQDVRVVSSPWNLGNLIFLNPFAAQGMSSSGQWFAFVALYFGGSVTLDALSGGNAVRPRVVAVVLTPQPPD